MWNYWLKNRVSKYYFAYCLCLITCIGSANNWWCGISGRSDRKLVVNTAGYIDDVFGGTNCFSCSCSSDSSCDSRWTGNHWNWKEVENLDFLGEIIVMHTEIHEIQSKLADVLVARTHSEVALANHWGGTFKISAILGNWVTTSQWEYAAHSITFGSGLWSYEKKEKHLKNLGFGFGFGWNWVSIETETFGCRWC